MKSVVVLLAAVVAAHCVTYFDIVAEEWEAFKLEHDKSYENETEERIRRSIFAKNKLYVAQHNQRFERGEETFRVALNQFSDMSHDEFLHTMNGFKSDADEGVKRCRMAYISPANVVVPEQVDWRTAGAVTDVQDQGQCRSCWAFSATGALEGQHFRKTGTLVSLSEQNLVDCSWGYGNDGCCSGTPNGAFRYVREVGGIDTEASYPYEGRVNICRYNATNSGANDVGCAVIPRRNETKLKEAVATVGPVSVAVNTEPESFQDYSTGVYYNKECTDKILTHAMLVVGYGTDKEGGDYWLLKNSWGTTWGEAGFMKLARNRDNHCGIASMASYPLV